MRPFPPLAPLACTFSRTWRPFHVFPRLVPVPCFPAIDVHCMFPCAWRPLYVFQRLASFACFPAPGNGCTVCFPELVTGCVFSRAWRRLHAFLRLALALGTRGAAVFVRGRHARVRFCFLPSLLPESLGQPSLALIL